MSMRMPLIKYTGSKRHIYPYLLELTKKAGKKKAVDPFVGGGSLVTTAYDAGYRNIIASDKSYELIGLYNAFQNTPQDVFDSYEELWSEEQSILKSNYYVTRDEFNKTRDPILFNYLTRLAINGSIRYNQKGFFNSSMGYGRNGCTPKNLKSYYKNWKEILDTVIFIQRDFRESLINIDSDTLVYIDPPYWQSHKSYYGAYDFDFNALWDFIREVNNRGARYIMTFGKEGDEDIVPEDCYTNREIASSGTLGFRATALAKTNYEVLDRIYLNWS